MNTRSRIMAATLSFALCLVFCSNAPLWAQRKGGTRGGQSQGRGPHSDKERLPSPEFDKTPFDVTRNQLPPVYIGHNVQLIYELIKNRTANGKGEKETAGQYLERTKREADLPLVGTLSLGSTYAFQITPAENFWNAHENILKVYCELSTILANGTEDRTKRGIRVRYIPQMDNHYTYTDANGRKLEFEEVKFRDYTVAFENFKQFSSERVILPSVKQEIDKRSRKGNPESSSDDGLRREMIVASLKVQPAEADQLKESSRVLVVCSLVDPYVTSDTVQRKGTPERPGEYLAQHEYLHIRLLELWFYDAVIGKVLMKMKPGDASPLS
jgi:hypothetical protein